MKPVNKGGFINYRASRATLKEGKNFLFKKGVKEVTKKKITERNSLSLITLRSVKKKIIHERKKLNELWIKKWLERSWDKQGGWKNREEGKAVFWIASGNKICLYR